VLGAGNPAAVFIEAQGRGAIQSIDGGQTWSEPLLGQNNWLLAADRLDPQVFYAGTYGSGGDIFLSKVNAVGSALVYSTYLGGLGVDEAHAIAVDSQGAAYLTGSTCSWRPQDFLCQTQGGDAFVMKVNAAGMAIAYSTNLGGSLDDAGNAIAVDGAGNVYVAGQTLSPDFPTRSPLRPQPAAGAIVQSEDGGASWSPASIGLPLRYVDLLAVSPAPPFTVYTLGRGLLYRSEDNGHTWTGTPLPDGISAIAIDPRTPATLWAAGSARSNTAEVFVSLDGGNRWQRVDGALRAGDLRVVLVDPQQSSTVYAAGAGGLFKTSDGGATWSLILPGSFHAGSLAVSPGPKPVLFAARDDQAGSEIWKSETGGASWGSALQLPRSYPFVVAVDPNSPSTIYALGSNAFLKSTDTGETWTPVARIEGCDPRTLTISAGQQSVLYAGGYSDKGGSCMASSIDGGESWSRYEDSIPGTLVMAMAALPGNSGTLFAGVQPASDAFVTKLDRQGEIVYSTCLGGNRPDYATAIAVDAEGRAHVAGFTASEDFPEASKGVQSRNAGSGDAFVVRIRE
jgi:photosystem II stability/assembly factor-like uncharacterized protein